MNFQIIAFTIFLQLFSISLQIPCPLCTFSNGGEYINDEAECNKCLPGKCTSNTGTSCSGDNNPDICCPISLVQCQAGAFSVSGYDIPGKSEPCHPCGIGTFSNNAGEKTCYKCPINQSTSNTGNTYCDLMLLFCPVGTFSQTGYDEDGKGNGCSKCVKSTYSNKIGSTSCQICPLGKSNQTNGSSTCDFYLVQCPPGLFSKTGYDEDGKGNGCAHCPVGKFNDKPGQTSCQNCPIGLSTTLTGLIKCDLALKQCPQGTFSQTGFDQDTKETGCQPCYKSTNSQSGSTVCNLKACDLGFYSQTGFDNDGKGGGCKVCNFGFTTPQDQTMGNNDSVCTEVTDKCPKGYYYYLKT